MYYGLRERKEEEKVLLHLNHLHRFGRKISMI